MNCDQLNVAFAGTPEFAAVALKALIESKHRVVGVLTQPDRPAGRGRKLTASPVKAVAQHAGIQVQQPVNFKNTDDFEAFLSLQADILVVAAYGIILPQRVLDAPPLGCLNIHASLLPRWRGAAPIHRAVLAGDEVTGISIMQMDAGLDTGDVLVKVSTPIGQNDTSAELHDRLAALGAKTLVDALSEHCEAKLIPKPQAITGVTYAEKLNKHEARLDFHSSSENLHRCVCAFNPWPVAEAQLSEQRVRIWCSEIDISGPRSLDEKVDPGTILEISKDALWVKTANGVIKLLKLQWPGKKAQSAWDFSQGKSLIGQRFS